MSQEELARHLRAIYSEMGDQGNTVIAFCLFAALYCKEINDFNNKDRVSLCRKAGLPESYAGEIYKGIKLASYMDLKPHCKNTLLDLIEANDNKIWSFVTSDAEYRQSYQVRYGYGTTKAIG